jgi:hypothetical protein
VIRAISDRDLSVRPALRFVPYFSFGKVKLNSIRTNYLCPRRDPYTGGDTKKRTVVRKLNPFVDRLERWFLVVSDIRIQTRRKIPIDIKKIRDSSNGLSLKERKG